MATQEMDPAVSEFGERFLEYLIAAEMVSRGTGPAKFLGENDFQNVLIFDSFVKKEDELPDIWRDSGIVLARQLAKTPKSERHGKFEQDYAAIRREVWNRFSNLYYRASEAATRINNQLVRDIRISELESVKANYDLTGFTLGLSHSVPSFMQSQFVITGDYHIETEDSLDRLAAELSDKLSRRGFAGNLLQEQMIGMEASTYLRIERVVPEYKSLIEKLRIAAVQLLGIDDKDLVLVVKALPESENKTGSFEYEGNGRAVTSMRESRTTTLARTVYVSAHEMVHCLQHLLIETYFKRTGDMFAAAGTMCTSSVAFIEGQADMGHMIYKPVVMQALGNDKELLDIIVTADRLRKAAVHYTCRLGYQRLFHGHADPEEVFREMEAVHLKYGMDQESATKLARGIVNQDIINKIMFYRPFYGVANRVVERIFSRFSTFEEGMAAYRRVSSEIGPITLNAANKILVP
ncbi:TPA: hypothetical protein HA246_03220 [Candidatus Woesearchaeota archaeon]|nr:hypothetical protein [Candidatus Woesearchaeota archaeon]